MIIKVAFVMYLVIDLTRVRDFYKNILEISINTMSELGLNMIYFKLFVLHLQSLQRKKYRLAQAQENSIAFEVENLELMLEKLKQ